MEQAENGLQGKAGAEIKIPPSLPPPPRGDPARRILSLCRSKRSLYLSPLARLLKDACVGVFLLSEDSPTISLDLSVTLLSPQVTS